MKKPMLVFLAVFACAALAPQAVRAGDPPDLKETLKWLKRYVNEEAGGLVGDNLPADAPSGATGRQFSFKYQWVDTAWTSPDEATADGELTMTDRSTGKATKYTCSLKLKGLKLDGLSIDKTHLLEGDGYWLTIPVNDAVTVMQDGETDKLSTCVILFPTEAAANKAFAALRRAAQLAGAADETDPFASDPPKHPVVSSPDPITTPPPPADDGKAARRAELDTQIAAAADAVSDDEQKLSDLEGKVLGANLALVAAKAAYNNAESGSFGEVVAAAAVVTAEGVVDDLNSQKDGVASDLKADRDRLNELKRERARLGN